VGGPDDIYKKLITIKTQKQEQSINLINNEDEQTVVELIFYMIYFDKD
jgi:hypothetical protein